MPEKRKPHSAPPGGSTPPPGPPTVPSGQLQRDRAAKWVTEKWTSPNKQCPICSTSNWSITESAELRLYQGSGLVVGGPVFPVFTLVCQNCGYTIFFNAVAAGTLTEDGKPHIEMPPPDVEQPGPE